VQLFTFTDLGNKIGLSVCVCVFDDETRACSNLLMSAVLEAL